MTPVFKDSNLSESVFVAAVLSTRNCACAHARYIENVCDVLYRVSPQLHRCAPHTSHSQTRVVVAVAVELTFVVPVVCGDTTPRPVLLSQLVIAAGTLRFPVWSKGIAQIHLVRLSPKWTILWASPLFDITSSSLCAQEAPKPYSAHEVHHMKLNFFGPKMKG